MIPVTPDWASAAITIQPITADLLQDDEGGSPFMMKLIALTGGLQLLTQLNLTGTVITDCQSLTRKLQMSSADLPYSSDTMGQMAPGAAPDPSLWMVPHIWGNFLAVRYAGTPNAPPPLAFPSFVALPPLPYHEISEAAIRTTDWHFAHRHHYDVEPPDSNPGLSHLPRRLARGPRRSPTVAGHLRSITFGHVV